MGEASWGIDITLRVACEKIQRPFRRIDFSIPKCAVPGIDTELHVVAHSWSMNTTLWSTCVDCTGILIITVYRCMNTSMWATCISSTWILIIAIYTRMNTAFWSACIDGTGILIIAVY